MVECKPVEQLRKRIQQEVEVEYMLVEQRTKLVLKPELVVVECKPVGQGVELVPKPELAVVECMPAEQRVESVPKLELAVVEYMLEVEVEVRALLIWVPYTVVVVEQTMDNSAPSFEAFASSEQRTIQQEDCYTAAQPFVERQVSKVTIQFVVTVVAVQMNRKVPICDCKEKVA